jgi:hypothetical protein
MESLPVELQEGEQVIMRVHRHVFFLLSQLVGVILFGVIPVIVLLVLAPTSGQLLTILAVIWGIVTLIAAYFIWYRYQHDEWIVTNQRLIDSVRKHWFHHDLKSTDLINIEDMSVSKNGFFQTVFNYGDLRCQTAGHLTHFTLRGIPNPSGVLDVVDNARDEARQRLGYVGRVLQQA